MPSVPSIKGSALLGLFEDIKKFLAKGSVSRVEIERWLKPEDVALLEQEALVSDWYDIRMYVRMSELLRDVVGSGRNEYLKQRGRQSARRLIEAGLYQQMEYLHNTRLQETSGAQARFEAFGRDLRLLTTLSASILNFSKWEAKPDPDHDDRYVIHISEAKDYPEVLCWSAEGFLNEMAVEHGEPDLWRWDRPAADLVLFRMSRGL